MAADVPQGAGAEVPPATPGEREIGRMVRPRGRRAKPEVPVQGVGHRRRAGRAVDALRPEDLVDAIERPVRPDVNLPHLPDRAGPDRLAEDPHLFTRLALVPHCVATLCCARPGP